MKGLSGVGQVVKNEVKDVKGKARRIITIVQFGEKYGSPVIVSETAFFMNTDFVCPGEGTEVSFEVDVNGQYINLRKVSAI